MWPSRFQRLVASLSRCAKSVAAFSEDSEAPRIEDSTSRPQWIESQAHALRRRRHDGRIGVVIADDHRCVARHLLRSTVPIDRVRSSGSGLGAVEHLRDLPVPDAHQSERERTPRGASSVCLRERGVRQPVRRRLTAPTASTGPSRRTIRSAPGLWSRPGCSATTAATTSTAKAARTTPPGGRSRPLPPTTSRLGCRRPAWASRRDMWNQCEEAHLGAGLWDRAT